MKQTSSATLTLALLGLLVLAGCATNDANLAGDAKADLSGSADTTRTVRANSCDADANCEANAIVTGALTFNGEWRYSYLEDTLNEGDTEIYTLVGSPDLETTAVLIADDLSFAKFSINGWLTPQLAPGACVDVSGAPVELCVEEIAGSSAGVVTFHMTSTPGNSAYLCVDMVTGAAYKSAQPCR